MVEKETLKNDLIKASPPLPGPVLAEILALIEADDLAGTLNKIAAHASLINLPAHFTVVVNPDEAAPEDQIVLKSGGAGPQGREL
jgi:hypothetical protein